MQSLFFFWSSNGSFLAPLTFLHHSSTNLSGSLDSGEGLSVCGFTQVSLREHVRVCACMYVFEPVYFYVFQGLVSPEHLHCLQSRKESFLRAKLTPTHFRTVQ